MPIEKFAQKGGQLLHEPTLDDKKASGGQVVTKMPYEVDVRLVGACMLLYHRYDPEVVESKGKAKKGSAEKKEDNVESFVYRLVDGELAIPAVALKESICNAAKYVQDPRSKRKSARDLFRASLLITPERAGVGQSEWSGIDKRGVRVQQNRVTRSRPFLAEGWKADFRISVMEPEYIDQGLLQDTVERAGRLVGLLDFRPDYGRFRLEKFELVKWVK